MTDKILIDRKEAEQVLEALERYQVKRQDFDRFADEITTLKVRLAEQLAQQEPVVSRWDSDKYDELQRQWCVYYEHWTGFEPLMDDYEVGNESFVVAANNSVRWYESHTSDMYLRISNKPIPGDEE